MNEEKPKIALVADWITHWGGAERVFAKLMEMYPEADIYTSVFFPARPEVFQGRRVHKSFIHYIPFLNRRHKLCMLLRPLAFSLFDFQKYDLVISATSAEAKGIIIKNKAKRLKNRGGFLKDSSTQNSKLQTQNSSPIHICYCHTPTRYLWSHSDAYKNFLEFGRLNWLAKLVIPTAFRIMKKWDYRAAQRPDIFIANSATTQSRIAEFYERDSVVVYPFYSPVSSSRTSECKQGGTSEDPGSRLNTTRSELFSSSEMDSRLRGNDGKGYFICLGRVVPYKRFDIAIEACNARGLPLKIFTSTHNALTDQLQKIS